MSCFGFDQVFCTEGIRAIRTPVRGAESEGARGALGRKPATKASSGSYRRPSPPAAGRAYLHQASRQASSALLARATSAARQAPPATRAPPNSNRRRDRLGGLIHEYYALAAYARCNCASEFNSGGARSGPRTSPNLTRSGTRARETFICGGIHRRTRRPGKVITAAHGTHTHRPEVPVLAVEIETAAPRNATLAAGRHRRSSTGPRSSTARARASLPKM
jgi:hypothetical protein